MDTPPVPLANVITLGAQSIPAPRDFYERLGWPLIIDADPEDNYWEIAWAPGDNAIVAAARRAARIDQ